MDFPTIEAKYDSFYVPTFEIDIEDGDTFSPAEGGTSSVRVSTSIDIMNHVSFSVGGVYDQQKSTFVGLKDAGLTVGSDLSVALGYGGTTEPVFEGTITEVRPSFPEGSAPTVNVTAKDYRYAMDQAASDESFDGTTVTDAAKQIGRRYGFSDVETDTGGSVDGGASELELTQLVRDAQSEYDFLQKLARRFDYELFSRTGVLVFRRPPAEQSPAASLTYGQGLRSFEANSRTAQTDANSVKYTGVNHYTGERVAGESKRSGDGDGGTVLRKAAIESDTEARQRSAGTATEMDRAQTSDATTLGLPDVQIGQWLELDGLGSLGEQTYDGVYYVQATDHTIRESGYTTRFTLSEKQ